MNESDEIRERITERLGAVDLTIQGASLKAGLGQTTLRDFMVGRSQSITLGTLSKLADALQTTVEYLHSGTGTPAADPEEAELHILVQKLDRSSRKIVLDVARGLIGKKQA